MTLTWFAACVLVLSVTVYRVVLYLRRKDRSDPYPTAVLVLQYFTLVLVLFGTYRERESRVEEMRADLTRVKLEIGNNVEFLREAATGKHKPYSKGELFPLSPFLIEAYGQGIPFRVLEEKNAELAESILQFYSDIKSVQRASELAGLSAFSFGGGDRAKAIAALNGPLLEAAAKYRDSSTYFVGGLDLVIEGL